MQITKLIPILLTLILSFSASAEYQISKASPQTVRLVSLIFNKEIRPTVIDFFKYVTEIDSVTTTSDRKAKSTTYFITGYRINSKTSSCSSATLVVRRQTVSGKVSLVAEVRNKEAFSCEVVSGT